MKVIKKQNSKIVLNPTNPDISPKKIVDKSLDRLDLKQTDKNKSLLMDEYLEE